MPEITRTYSMLTMSWARFRLARGRISRSLSSTEMYAAHRELVDLIRVDHIKHGAGCPQHQGGACDCSARRVRELVDLLRRGHGPAQT